MFKNNYRKVIFLFFILFSACSSSSDTDSDSIPVNANNDSQATATKLNIEEKQSISIQAGISAASPVDYYRISLPKGLYSFFTSDTSLSQFRCILTSGSKTIEENIITNSSKNCLLRFSADTTSEFVIQIQGDNNSTGSYRLSLKKIPDLTIGNFANSEKNIRVGERFDLPVTVNNQGSSISSPTILRYYKSTARNISQNDEEIASSNIRAIESGAIFSESKSILGHSSGTVYYGVCVDAIEEEFDKTNNCSAVGLKSSIVKPDLVISSFDAYQFNNSKQKVIRPGDSIQLTAVIKNIGATYSNVTTLRYYKSNDKVISSSDEELTTDSISSLSVNAITSRTKHIPGPTSDIWYYGVCAEPIENELNENNNCSSGIAIGVNFPDLEISSFSINPTNIESGKTIRLFWRIRNVGVVDSTDATLNYYQSTDSNIDFNDTTIDSESISSFSTGGNISRGKNIHPHSSGILYYGVCVRSLNEFSEENNCSSAVAVGVNTPDLTFLDSGFTATPTIIDSSGDINLSAVVSNIGTGDSTFTTLRYYRSSDNTISPSDEELTSDSISTLLAKNRTMVASKSSGVVVSGHRSGISYYGACVDTFSNEFDSENNCSDAVAVGANISDLIISSFIANPAIVKPGETITLSAVVKNNGTASSNSTTLRYYRSSDNTISRSDEQLATDSIQVLAKQRTISKTMTITSNHSTFQYYGVCVDSFSNEFQSANNCSSAFRVGPILFTNVANVSYFGRVGLGKGESLATAIVGNKTFLFTAWEGEGVSVYDVSKDGVLNNIRNLVDGGNLEISGASSVTTAKVGNKTYLFVVGRWDNGVSVFDVSVDGSLNNVDNTSDNSGSSSNFELAHATLVGEKTFLFIAEENNDAVSVFDVSTDGTLNKVHRVSNDNNLKIERPFSLATAVVDNKVYLFVGGYDDDGVSVFEVSTDGSLNNVFNQDDDNDLKLNGVSSLATAIIEKKVYLFVAGELDNGVSVFEVSTDGSLNNVFNQGDDNDNLVISGASSLTTAEVDKKVYLFVAGKSESGVSVFEVSGDGSLTNIINVEDSEESNYEFNEASFVVTTQISKNNYLFVTGTGLGESGVSVFQMNRTDNTTTSDAKEIQLGQSYSDNLSESSSDYGNLYYKIYLFAENYTIRTNSNIDTYCELYSANNLNIKLATSDNISVSDSDCSMAYNVPLAGYYYIKISGGSRGVVGNYTLEIYQK